MRKYTQSVFPGEVYGRLTVLEYVSSRDVICLCSCGNRHRTASSEIKRGHTQSCGCLKLEAIVLRSRTHGASKSLLHYVWLDMLARCRNPKHKAFRHYGGRGISVCPEWQESFEAFRDWANMFGYQKGLSIDRRDNNGPYHPKNCRWSTDAEQSRNKRNNHFFSAFGETKCLADWVDDSRCNVPMTALKSRIYKLKWPTEYAITAKLRSPPPTP